MNNYSSPRFVLRDLSLATRIVLSLFLISVGVGYFAALVQLHFQGASPGKHLPGPEEVISTYHGGGPNVSLLERLLVTDEKKAMNSSGSMRSAFTFRSSAWEKEIKKRAQAKKINLLQAEKELRAERNGEVAALVHWIHEGNKPKFYETDAYPLPAALAHHPITEKFVGAHDDGTKVVKIKTIFNKRCVRCHEEGGGSSASEYPLDSYKEINDYLEVGAVGGGMPLKKLAQTTHVHLLGFAMLFCLTGVIFTLTDYPGWVRVILGPFPLLAQLADISCWWLARLDPTFAKTIMVTGGLVAVGLASHIVLGLLNMFDKKGKLILLLLIAGAVAGALLLKTDVIDPYLMKEGLGAVETERTLGE
jgi:hypothetical protein